MHIRMHSPATRAEAVALELLPLVQQQPALRFGAYAAALEEVSTRALKRGGAAGRARTRSHPPNTAAVSGEGVPLPWHTQPAHNVFLHTHTHTVC